MFAMCVYMCVSLSLSVCVCVCVLMVCVCRVVCVRESKNMQDYLFVFIAILRMCKLCISYVCVLNYV